MPVLMFHGWPDSYMRQSDARILLGQFRGQTLMVKQAVAITMQVLWILPRWTLSLAKFWPPKAVATSPM